MPRNKRSHIIRYGAQGITWLLRDEFTTDRAAGAVNGTAAEPGPGTRTVKDTTAKISISGGKAAFSGGISDLSDPGLWLDAVTRTAGRFLLAQITPTNIVATGGGIGWINNPGVGIGAGGHLLLFSPTGFNLRDHATAVSTLLTGRNESYYFAIVLRSTGCYYFMRNITDTANKWCLFWVSEQLNLTPMYPEIWSYDMIHATDFIRIPDTVWLPTPLCYDTFTRADAVLGTSEVVGPDSQACSTKAWTATTGTWGISTNKAMCSALAGGIGIATIDAGVRDVLVSTAVTVAGGTAGVVASYVDANNYIYAYHNGTNATLVKVVAGAPSTLIDAAAAYAAGAVLEIHILGSIVALNYNGAKIDVNKTVSDAGLLTGTKCGLFTSDITNSLDKFMVFPRGTADEYAVLKKWNGSTTGGAILLAFDDGSDTVYEEAFPYMESKGLHKATVYLAVSGVGGVISMTWAQLQEMYAAGWDIGNHTQSHLDLTTKTEAQQEAEFTTAKAAIDAHGMPRASNHVSYPFGAHNADTATAMTATGMLTGRTTVAGSFTISAPPDLFELPVAIIDASTSLAVAKAYVVNAIMQNKCQMLLFHTLTAVPVGGDWSIANYQAFMDWLASIKAPLMTISELYTLL